MCMRVISYSRRGSLSFKVRNAIGEKGVESMLEFNNTLRENIYVGGREFLFINTFFLNLAHPPRRS